MLPGATCPWSACVPNDDLSPEERWPGVYPAYDFVRASYDWMMHRLNAVESRIQTLMMFSASFTVTGPVLVALLAEEASLKSGWFVAAVALALLNLLIGAVARAYCGLKTLGGATHLRGMVGAHRLGVQEERRVLGGKPLRTE